MNFLISDTFTTSLTKLTGEEQKSIKNTAFDLQVNPANPGFSFHKLDRARDKHFWSVRVNRDIRIIVHRTDASLLMCYVDHHDGVVDQLGHLRLCPAGSRAHAVQRGISTTKTTNHAPSSSAQPRSKYHSTFGPGSPVNASQQMNAPSASITGRRGGSVR